MSIAANKELIQRYFDAISGNDKPASLISEFATDEALHHHIAFFEGAFPHYELFIDDLIAEDDKVTVRARFAGTHNGDLMGIAPTGKQAALPFIIIYRISNGKIVEHWMAVDQMDLMKQLGVIQ
ncbi:MAG: ester cyclase [Acidobacteria bacterium]|nr:ester cyclase [Acidobacteriota bacterium]